jgi:hypothetical protein
MNRADGAHRRGLRLTGHAARALVAGSRSMSRLRGTPTTTPTPSSYLIRALPKARATRLRQELALLHRSAERLFSQPEDRILAEVADFRWVGGE